jgi:endonuclease-3
MTLRERYDYVMRWFEEQMPAPETELDFENPFQLLVAVILSAQCTDKRVNLVTPSLFAVYPDAHALSAATFDDVQPLIKTVSFANNKTRHLLGAAKLLVEKHSGEVPQTIEELVLLPGVGRKTANVVVSVAWSQPAMAVDTHVFRTAARLGLTKSAKNPAEAEAQLVKHIPEALLHRAHHWLILHGRYICVARRPHCEECGLKPACKFYEKEMQYVVRGEREMNHEKDAVHKVDGGKKRIRRDKPDDRPALG